MAAAHGNDPISHCKNGQGGRTFSRMKPGNKGTSNKGSERLKLRQKVQSVPRGRGQYPFGKYYDWQNDPDNKSEALSLFMKKHKRG